MPPILLADLEQLIGALVAIASVVIWALNQAFDKSQEQQRQQEAARQKWLAEQRQRDAAGEVDTFLRDVSQGRRPQQPPRREVVTAEVVEAERAPDRLSERHLPSQLGQHFAEFDQHVQSVVDTDDVKSHLDEQIHAKFDHAVGRLEQAGRDDDQEVRPPAKPVKTAKRAKGKTARPRPADVVEAQVIESGKAADTGVLGMLSDPQRLRQAFVMQEALERPRW